MTVTLTEENKKNILETLTVEKCEHVIKSLMDDVEQIRQNDPEDFFGVEAIRLNDIKYYKLAIKLIEEATEKAEHVKFSATNEELEMISNVIIKMQNYVNIKDLDKVADVMMDIDACHSNGCPLDFKKLLNFDKKDLLHDLAGIAVCLDRTTGKLMKGFRPRCAI